jgi:hypothetical protein
MNNLILESNSIKNITPQYITESKDKVSKCNICCTNMIKGDIVVKLLCNHYYHYECILENYRNAKKKVRECPYCRSEGGWLPLMENMKPELHIHQEYFKKKCMTKCKCPAKLVSGYKKGKKCGNPGYKNYGGYCGKHKKHFILI